MRISDWSSDVCSSDLEGPNFSSFLRVFCMLEGEQALAREILGPTHHGLLDVVTNCPNPGLILSRYRTVIAYNKAFGEWRGPANVAVIGAELTTLVQVRHRRTLHDGWQAHASGRGPGPDAQHVGRQTGWTRGWRYGENAGG